MALQIRARDSADGTQLDQDRERVAGTCEKRIEVSGVLEKLRNY
jgi:hypothetical protein